ncbi:MAG TPA: 2OG-Fe(II) oxygenase [Caulobacteraceae bacterium]|nr:2OG-Fe(II) oxygenase [Caulobacteraceae bacterium]
MPDQSVEALRQAAASGDVLALTRLGEALLRSGAPKDVLEAAAALDQATRDGGVEAPAMLAAIFALGAAGIENWTAALDLLRIGAERGSSVAQGQLVVLAGSAAASHDAGRPDHWHILRESISPEAWFDPGPRRILSRSPQVYLHDPFASAAVCEWIIGRAEGRVTRALVYDPDAAGLRLEDARDNGAFAFDLVEMDVVMAMLRRRMAAATGVDPAALEPPQALHYRPGQRFEPHFDFLDPALPGHAADLARHGQRIATGLVYLNSGFEGGETDFPILGQRHRPPAGAALCFVNVQSSGLPDRRTLHAGLAPTSGEKWLLSQWIRDRPRVDRAP